ncbi:hypothetical protein V9R51_003722 [Vibrio cholerae]|nr:hypothetical protein [Vibrio cholerae]HAS3631090.1 hypothetical protein [Vibrio cholerae]HDI3178363.1 hypothetical protein [Vibrio cholerae]
MKRLFISITLLMLFGCASSPWDSMPYEEANAWQGIGVTAYDAYQFRSNGYTPVDIKPWKQAGFDTPDLIMPWVENDFSPEEAKAWTKKNFSIDQAVEFRSQGLTVK